MNILLVLVPLALLLALAGALAFRWAVRDGQYEDVDTPARRLLLDDEWVVSDASPDDDSEPSPHAPISTS